MKKKIIIGLALVSALSFGATQNNTMPNSQRNNTNQTQMMNSNNGGMFNQMNNLSEKEQTELTKLVQDRRETNYKKSLDLRSTQLEMEKLLAKDKVSWRNIERLNKKMSDMQSQERLESMKFARKIQDEYGISMRMQGGMMGGKDHKMMQKSSMMNNQRNMTPPTNK